MFLRLAKNSFALMFANLVDKFVYLILFMVIARKLSQMEFGIYNLVLALIFMGGLLTNFGIESVIIREVAKDRRQAGVFFNNALLVSLFFAFIAWGVIIFLTLVLHYDSRILLFLGVGGVIFIFMGINQTCSAIIKAHERMEIFAFVGASCSLLNLGMSVLVLSIGWGLKGLVAVLIGVEVLKMIVYASVVHNYFTSISFSFDGKIIIRIFKMAFPFALLMAYSLLVHKIYVLMLGWLRPLEDVAVYSVAEKFTDFLGIFSMGMVGALYPALSAKLDNSPEESWRLYNNSLGIFAILGIGSFFLLIVLAQPVIILLFGKKYLASAGVLRWLAGAYLFNVLSGPVGILLLAAGNQMKRLLTMCLVILICSMSLSLWLIPLWGYNGAAIVVFVSMILGFIGRLILSKAYFGRLPDFSAISRRGIVAGVVMALLLILFNKLNVIFLASLGCLCYVAVLAVLGEFRQPQFHEIRMMLRTLGKRKA